MRQAVFLMRVGNADIDIEPTIAEDPMPARFDRRLISQALTNIIKNATEAIAAVPPEELGQGPDRMSRRRAKATMIVIDVVDNGIGLPKENRIRLLEPYVTTREKGTGLGLAIVGKILEDHGGGIELHDAAETELPGSAARGCACVLPPTAASAQPTNRERRQGQACEWSSMTADILIVDDEADIRELVAGILQDEGYRRPHRARQRRCARRDRDAPAQSRVSRHLAAGQPSSTACSCSMPSRRNIPICRS